MRRAAGSVVRPCAAVLLLVAVSAGCQSRQRFDGERAYRQVLAQCELGARVPGSEASRRAAAHIASELRRSGWQVDEDQFEYGGVRLRNVVGRKGQGPVVLVGAHYDCRAHADLDPQDREAPVPGANDGASGVAVLLELARALDAEALDYEVRLAFFDAEDQGGIQGWPWSVGARHLADTLTDPPAFVIVVDMVGDTDQQLYWEVSSTPWLRQRLWSLAEELGYGQFFTPSEKHHLADDHTPFLERGIPAVDIIDFDYPPWHTTADTPDRVSAASLERVGRVVECLLEDCRPAP